MQRPKKGLRPDDTQKETLNHLATSPAEGLHSLNRLQQVPERTSFTLSSAKKVLQRDFIV
jgi:hypothetical protein